jgi:hypothetical protein
MFESNLRFKSFTRSAQVLVFLFLYLLVISASTLSASGKKDRAKINCDMHRGPCEQSLVGGTATLDIQPRPVKAMEDLTFFVNLSGIKPTASPFIDLGMPGMDMGPNRVHLKSTGPDTYEGTGIIVRCPSGRRTWKATLTVPGAGKAGFIFDVVY